MDIVIIPTYLRAEYLWLCLEYLWQTQAPGPKEFWVCEDRRENDEYTHKLQFQWTDEVLEDFRGRLNLKKIVATPHNYSGNTRNVLEAYKRAYQTDARFVYLVEDDVLVRPDFFKWHEAVQETESKTMCSVAYRCVRNNEARTDISDPEAYFTTARDYASIGVCWRRESLGPVIEHARPEYYNDLDGYIGRTFPGNRFATDFSEQDGLIMRVMWETRGFTTWPYVPRAYHMGYYGYHRTNGRRPNGFWRQKLDAIKATLHDAEQLKIVAPDFGDIEPLPRSDVAEWNSLCRVQHFE